MKKVSECGKRRGDVAAKAVFAASAAFSVFAVFAIVFYILYESIPALSEIGVFNFIFGTLWAPTKDFLDVSERFGVLPMIVGTLCVSAGAVLVGGVAGVFSAICLKAFCPKKLRGVIGGMINFLAGIPSIVYGFFGLTLLVPMLSDISSTGSGKGILASSLILGMMILPTVTSMTKDALDAVPDSYREGALALGATPQQAMFKVVVPAAKSGIITSLVLGMGRAVGETMAVMMVAGNVPEFPKGLFSNIRTLTINMVVEMGYATGLHRQALIATGSVLLVIVLALNFGIGLARRPKKYREKKGKNVLVSKSERCAPVFVKSGSGCTVLKYISIVCVAAVAASLATLIVFILVKGLPHIDANLLFGESGNAGMTLRPAFVTTGDAVGHAKHHIRIFRDVDVLRTHADEDEHLGWRHHAFVDDLADGDTLDRRELACGGQFASRGVVGARRWQIANDRASRVAFGAVRHSYGDHTQHRQDSGRVGGVDLHRGSGAVRA